MPSATARPSLQCIHRSETDKIIQAIVDDGCCIIKNFTTPEAVERVNADTRPYFDADKPWKGDLFPPETRRCARMASRSKTYREEWLVDPLVDKLTSVFVDKTTSNFYGQTKHTYTSRAIINTALSMEIGPGGKAQRLHRDDKNHHIEHVDQTKTGYRIGSDLSMAFLVPGIATRYENGATMAIPGSHLWDQERAPKVEEACCAEMEMGDAYVMLGGTYHGGGANQTTDTKRPMHGLFFCRGFLRTEENAYLAYSKEDVLSWSPEVQRIMGFTVSSPNIGFIDFVHPVRWYAGDYDPNQPGDLDESQETPKA
ncbi:phytanoyl-CoA dioxygenase family protein [Coleophoma cylindrospora]|uniref:Phytanoyl-CoA dioxygenase family protein n=1 Tax=Coleophoma cylindrospora TaxID=1849047 RepID=A0A3D8R6X0_9HELO|nr:phytanoyl-CoA dioxygenase family protein [Coleophoma cylindrospora]